MGEKWLAILLSHWGREDSPVAEQECEPFFSMLGGAATETWV